MNKASQRYYFPLLFTFSDGYTARVFVDDCQSVVENIRFRKIVIFTDKSTPQREKFRLSKINSVASVYLYPQFSPTLPIASPIRGSKATLHGTILIPSYTTQSKYPHLILPQGTSSQASRNLIHLPHFQPEYQPNPQNGHSGSPLMH